LAAERDDLMKANALLHALIGNREAEIERLRADKDVIRSQERNAAYERDIAALAAEIERLRAALHWLRPYVEGRSVYGRPHALDKIIDAALGQEVSGRDDHRSRNEDGAFSLYEENERLLDRAHNAEQTVLGQFKEIERLRAALKNAIEAIDAGSRSANQE
jgi:uncharacterized membrane protein